MPASSTKSKQNITLARQVGQSTIFAKTDTRPARALHCYFATRSKAEYAIIVVLYFLLFALKLATTPPKMHGEFVGIKGAAYCRHSLRRRHHVLAQTQARFRHYVTSPARTLLPPAPGSGMSFASPLEILSIAGDGTTGRAS